MPENITRCPQCQTSFRISDAHLNSARGAVRCGSCLNIFIARDHLIAQEEIIPVPVPHQEDDSEIISTQAPNHEVPQQTPVEEEEDDDDDLLISDDMDRKPAEQAGYMEDDFTDDFSDNAFSKSGDTGEFEFNLFERGNSHKDEPSDQDESWALNLMESDEEDLPTEPIKVERRPDIHEEQNEGNLEIPEEFEESYYTNSFQIIDEEPAPESLANTQRDIAREVFHVYDDEEPEDNYIEDDPYAENKYGGSQVYLDAIEPEPVEFAVHHHSELWHSNTLWAGLSVVAILVFVGQLSWVMFDKLSVNDRFRGYYETLCSLTGCELPVLIDRSKIRTTNLVVRSHPTQRNALIVDAILQNIAPFEQSFPSLDLVFTDRRDKVVAARRLLPSEYLGGELAGRKTMEKNRPIHIAIEIVDPGETAVGYKISIAD